MKFKVGNRVKAIGESFGWGSVEKGDIGKITKIKKKEGEIFVRFPAQAEWLAKEKDLVKVKAEVLTPHQKLVKERDKIYKIVLKSIKGLVKKYGQDNIRYSLNRWNTEEREKRYWLKQREEARKELREIDKRLK